MEAPRAHRPEAPEPVRAAPETPSAQPTDVRWATPSILRASHLAPLLRRTASILALAAIDAAGVTAGLFAALVLREVYYGRTPHWSLWHRETDWLPFLILVTLLVFAQANLYADRERRPGVGRIISSLLLVVLVSLAFGLGTGHKFSTYGLARTVFVLTAVLISALRGSYDALTGNLLRRAGVRRRALLVGAGDHLTHLHEMLGRRRGGIDYEFVGVLAPEPNGVDLPLLGDLKALSRILATHRVDEVILADLEFSERELLETVEQAHRRGVKFRRMYADAAEHQAYLERVNEASGPLFKMRRDPRVTPIGAILRRFSLDEIPQLLNVLRGEMSLVGPRPLPLRDYAHLEDWHRKRYNVLPGVTGLWQISGRSNLGFDDLVRLDFYYLENWSVWMDVAILVKTVPAVLAGRGAY